MGRDLALMEMGVQIQLFLELIEKKSGLKYRALAGYFLQSATQDDRLESKDKDAFRRKWLNWKSTTRPVLPEASALRNVLYVALREKWLERDSLPPEIEDLVAYLSPTDSSAGSARNDHWQKLKREVEKRQRLLGVAQVMLDGYEKICKKNRIPYPGWDGISISKLN